MNIALQSDQKRQIIDITDAVNSELHGSGIVSIFIKHTSTAVTTADLDPGTDLDLIDAIEALTPKLPWRHPHDPAHFPDHLWSTLIGTNILLPFSGSKLILGTWQRVILVELNGPKIRNIELSIVATSS